MEILSVLKSFEELDLILSSSVLEEYGYAIPLTNVVFYKRYSSDSVRLFRGVVDSGRLIYVPFADLSPYRFRQLYLQSKCILSWCSVKFPQSDDILSLS